MYQLLIDTRCMCSDEVVASEIRWMTGDEYEELLRELRQRNEAEEEQCRATEAHVLMNTDD
jgi:redox-regulated HSP33 family molecular chaperone